MNLNMWTASIFGEKSIRLKTDVAGLSEPLVAV
jgi:hypothetical protein